MKLHQKYRIAPDGPDGWKVQSKWFWLFWVTLYRDIGYMYSEPLSFDTEAKATAWIDSALDYDRRNAQWHKDAAARKATIPPREYP